MNHSKRAYLALLTAIAGIPFLAKPASAQLRVDTAGHALDANPQIGSGGYNNQIPNQPMWNQYQNAIATGDATNGYGFRGRTFNGVNLGAGYTDPFAFRGLLAGEGVDQFIANSTGVPTMANPTASSQNYAAPPNPNGIYYGSANHSAPPVGFQPSATNSGFVPQQPAVQSVQDSRLGTIDYSGSGQIIPKPYEMILPGPVDPTANPATPAQDMLAANSLFGVIDWKRTPEMQQADQSQNPPDFSQQSPLQQGLGPQIAQGLTQDQIRDLRQQFNNQRNSTGAAGNKTNFPDNGASPLAPLRAGGENSTSDQPLSPLLSQDTQLKSPNLSPEAGDLSTDQSTRQYPTGLNVPPPTQQSAQFAKLRQSIDAYDSAHSMSDEEANRKFQQILRLRDMSNVAAENGSNVLTGPGIGAANPGGIPSPDQPGYPSGTPPTNNTRYLKPGFNTVPSNMGAGPGMGALPASPAPVPIDNFAKDVPAKGLADLIARGDVSLQKGQYDKAIAAYNQAIDVVPNNPLILVARSIAEMAGGYYAQANTDLHIAISEDPAVLMAQYDLQKQIGEPRLKKMLSELKDIATSSQDNTLHAFLLTFCYYNSRHVGQAAEWLQTTDHRSNGQDPAVIQMKKYWNFTDELPAPAAPSAPGSSKSAPSPHPIK